jgi:hypothetical protein
MIRARRLALLGGGSSFADAFTRGDGALGKGWFGPTWEISSEKAMNTPVPGSELLLNVDFSAWTSDNPNNWTIVGESGGNEVSEVGTGEGNGGEGTGFCNIYTTSANCGLYQGSKATVGRWYVSQVLIDTVIAGQLKAQDFNVQDVSPYYHTTGTKVFTFRAAHTSYGYGRGNAVATDVTIDDVSLKQLTLSELLATRRFKFCDYLAQVTITTSPNGSQAGLVLNLDDASNPANFVLAFHDGANAKLWKCVAGTYTQLISQAATYGTAKPLKVIKTGTTYQLYYDGLQIGTDQTVSDAGIIGNKIHGMFNTWSVARLDSFSIEKKT